MRQPLLATKLFVPAVNASLVQRSRLIQKLDRGLELGSRLFLVSAPAGYGKSTLLVEWLQHIHTDPDCRDQIVTGWLSVDEGDNDLERFLRYFIGSLQKADENLGREALSLLDYPAGAVQAEDIRSLLINDLTAQPAQYIVVLDDFHLIQSLSVHQWMDGLLGSLPPNFHLVIATRADPLLRLSRLRAHGQLTEIRSDEIRFTPDETAAFINGPMSLALEPNDMALLQKKTEGWIAGLQMAALAIQAPSLSEENLAERIQTISGADRYVMDYLLEEILIHQPPAVQEYLLKTSVLRQMCGSLCTAVLKEDGKDEAPGASGFTAQPLSTGTPGGILEYLERANLFIIPLDNQRTWYRYHHLFADLLQKRASQLYAPTEISQWRMRASRWYEEQGNFHEAVEYALAAGEKSRAADLLERDGIASMQRTAKPLPEAWIKAFDRKDLLGRPMLCVVAAFSELFSHPEPPGPMEEKLDLIAEALAVCRERRGFDDDPMQEMVIRGYLAALQSSVSRVRGTAPEIIIQQASEALLMLPKEALMARFHACRAKYSALFIQGDPEGAKPVIEEAVQIAREASDEYHLMSSIFSQAHLAVFQGQLREADRICRTALADLVEPVEETGRPYLGSGILHLWLGRISLERNDLEEAEKQLVTGIKGLKYLAEPYMTMRGWAWLGKVHWLQGRLSEAEADFEKSRLSWPGAERYVKTQEARLALMSGTEKELEKAVRWAETVELDSIETPLMRSILLEGEWHFIDQSTLVRLYLGGHRRNRSIDLQSLIHSLDLQGAVAAAHGWGDRRVEILILKALAYAADGEEERAVEQIQRVLPAAEPEGYLRVFLDEGEPVRSLLHKVDRASLSWSGSDYLSKVLSAFSLQTVELDAKPQPSSGMLPNFGGLIEPLTDREVEVLKLLAAGYSNLEIAQKLFLSPNTLKAHTQNIYGKLEVHSRVQAVNRAREAGIL